MPSSTVRIVGRATRQLAIRANTGFQICKRQRNLMKSVNHEGTDSREVTVGLTVGECGR